MTRVVGGVTFEGALRSLAPRGRLVVISALGKRRVDFDAIDFYHNESRIFGADTRKISTLESSKLLASLVPGFESDQYHAPLVGQTYSLSQAVTAYEAVSHGARGAILAP